MGKSCLNDAETLRSWTGAGPVEQENAAGENGKGSAPGSSSVGQELSVERDSTGVTEDSGSSLTPVIPAEDELFRRAALERNFIVMPGYTAATEGEKWLDHVSLHVCEEVGGVELE